jgi:arylsulfatase A-like enzyme
MLSAAPAFAFGMYELVDRISLFRLNFFIDFARVRRELPAVTIVYMLAPDFRGYAGGFDSADYRQALRHTDRQIGRVLGDMQRAGMLDGMIIGLASDHGLGSVTKRFNLPRFLRNELGIDVARARLWEITPFEQRLATYQRHTAVVYGAGDRHRAIHLRKPIEGKGVLAHASWLQRPSAEDLRAYPTRSGPEAFLSVRGTLLDLPAALVAQDAIDAVAYAVAPDRVRLVLADGEVEFHQPAGRGGPISYRALRGDPLGWDGAVAAELLDGQPHPIRQWLAGTIDTDFPGLPAGLIAYFRARRAGDLAVFAAEGWDFGTHLRAGHGGLRADEMLTPLLLAGPGVPVGRLDVAQAVDVMPTILTLLGADIPDDLDGRPLLGASSD